MKYIYLIRHSSPFVEIENYINRENILWDEYNTNMLLSVEGEHKALELCNIKELHKINNVYSSNSPRAIQTAKYISEMNNTKIKLDTRINERYFGIEHLYELPEDYTSKSFNNKNFKINNGESLNELDIRFKDFLQEILNNNTKTIIVIHGIILSSFLQNYCEFKYENDYMTATYNNKKVIEAKPKSPGVYKITYNDNNELIDIDVIN